MPLRFLIPFIFTLAIFIASIGHAQVGEPVLAPWSYTAQNTDRTYDDTTYNEKSPEGENTTDMSQRERARFENRQRIRDQQYLNAQTDRSKDQAEITPLSNIESMYSGRVINELHQFGYDLFASPDDKYSATNEEHAKTVRPMGAVQDSYVLGIGDELDIAFFGQRTDRATYSIDTKGRLLLADFPAINAAGKTIAQLRLEVIEAAQDLHNTDAYISLSNARQISVLVVGHVNRPGKKTLSVFHTVLDALMEADGIQKSGSLRQIKLVRNGKSQHVDIYDLLLENNAAIDINLRDGDRIIVPAIGPTVAVAGEAKRPGIYEIHTTMKGMRHMPHKRSEKLSLNNMLALSGGVMAPGRNRFLRLEVTPDGEEQVAEINEPFVPSFGDGSILMISKGEARRANTIELSGHTRRPGLHALRENKTLSALFDSKNILDDDIYPLIGVIERWNPDQLAHKLLGFPLRLVLTGDYDETLQDGDHIHLFSNEQIHALQNADTAQKNTRNSTERNDAVIPAFIADFLRERAAFIRGGVRKAGAYPVDEGTTLESLLAVAGGLTLEASSENIEITSDQIDTPDQTRRRQINLHETHAEEILITAGDSVRVNQRFKKITEKSVLIIGEVQNPGRYDLLPGDRMSDLMTRAGGFTEQAYPSGAIFSRASERRAEEARYRAQARQMKQSIAAAIEATDQKVHPTKISEAMALADELEQAKGAGRITVEADLAKLKTQPELDLLLENGDKIYVPKRSLTVRVSGEVLSPATLQFREEKEAHTYIDEAGGFSFHADKGRTFVLYPDGSAQPLRVSSWSHNATFIPPRSAIIVPRDPEPFNFVQSAKDISQILSNLAITSIFINDVRDD